MNMQINASAFKPAPVLKTLDEIDSDVCDLRKRAEVLMNLIDAFEESVHLLQEKGSINREDFKMTSFDLVAFQGFTVAQSSWRRGLYKALLPAAEAIVTTLKGAGNGAIASRHPNRVAAFSYKFHKLT